MRRRVFITIGGAVLGLLAAGSGGIGYMLHKLNRIGRRRYEFDASPERLSQSSLFNQYPELARHIPWVSLGNIPTPVQQS